LVERYDGVELSEVYDGTVLKFLQASHCWCRHREGPPAKLSTSALNLYSKTDRSKREDVTGCRRDERYNGVEVEPSLYVSTATLSVPVIRSSTGSQCSDLSSGRASAWPPRRHGLLDGFLMSDTDRLIF